MKEEEMLMIGGHEDSLVAKEPLEFQNVTKNDSLNCGKKLKMTKECSCKMTKR